MAPAGWMLGCGCLFSCSAIFGIDESDRRDEPELGGAGAADPGSGGLSTGGRSTGGRSTGGTPTGGRDGNGGQGGGGAVGNQAGTAGQTPGGTGGEGGGEDRGAILGEPCTIEETLTNTACTVASPHLVLECYSGVWRVKQWCEADQACIPEKSDVEQAQCRNISGSCADSYTNVCQGQNVLVDCETFRPDRVLRQCPFGCREGACLPGTGDQLIVHTGPGGGAFTRRLTLPVCVLVENDGDEDLVGWIRDEVERTWARHTNFNFEGWAECPTLPDEGVVLSFESACRGHLVNDIDPRGTLVRLEICRSFYLESDAELQDVKEPLARFLGRHHFGHVIGVPDLDSRRPTTMVRSIELTRITEYEISSAELGLTTGFCAPDCRKHPGALVTYRGRCLEAYDGSIVARTCAEHGEFEPQDFTLRMSELFMGADAQQCVTVAQVGQNTEVRAGECTPTNERFALKNAALRSLGFCAAPASLPATPGTALWIRACDAVPESWTGWSFEVTGANDIGLLARIRYEDLCVSVPGGAGAANLVLELRDCEEEQANGEQTFELRHNGEIAFGDNCFAWDDEGSVYLNGYCGGSFSDHWTVTGALTTSTGLALTLTEDDGVTAQQLDGTPSETQTFDFYF
jgi:hypothetical protein